MTEFPRRYFRLISHVSHTRGLHAKALILKFEQENRRICVYARRTLKLQLRHLPSQRVDEMRMRHAKC